jgi:hypothetical protein
VLLPGSDSVWFVPGPLGAALDAANGGPASSTSSPPATADSAAADGPIGTGGKITEDGSTGNRRMLRNYQTREEAAAAADTFSSAVY